MKLIFATDHTTPGGRSYKQDSVHEVNDADARDLIHWGIARPDDSKPTQQADKAAK